MPPGSDYIALLRPPGWALPLGIALLVTGITSGALGIRAWSNLVWSIRNEVHVVGEVTAVREESGSNGAMYRPEFGFLDPGSGEFHRWWHSSKTRPPAFVKGEAVPIRFPPGRPEAAALDTRVGGSLLGFLALAGGGVCLAGAAWLLIAVRRFVLFPPT